MNAARGVEPEVYAEGGCARAAGAAYPQPRRIRL